MKMKDLALAQEGSLKMDRTRNERRKARRNEVIAAAAIVAFAVALMWFGFELRGALEACAW